MPGEENDGGAEKHRPPSVGDYELVRRQFAVFEHALKKFGADVALWVASIRKARDEGARALVGGLCARRVLSLPPHAKACG
jgi:U3 small nucleolar RNA-associated protein 6